VFRLSIRSLLAHKLRMAMSVFAVVLGTAFVSGALVFGSSLTSILDGAFTGSAVDLQVSPKPAVDADPFGPASTVTLKDEALGTVRAVPGVVTAQGYVEQLGVYVLDAKNKIAGGTNGGPGIGLAWLGTGGTSRVTQGAAPSGADDVVIDERTADAAGLRAGDRATVLLANGTRQQFRVSGLFVPPGADLGQQTQVVFTPATAQRLLLEPGTWSGAAVTLAGGADPGTVKAAVAKDLGNGYTVKTRAEQIQEAKDAAGTFVNIFTYVLLGFAVVALLVGGFLIFNTFSMVVAQRAREMALLRAVGARRQQVSRALLGEAAIVGLVGSVIGLVLGLLVAVGLGKLLGAVGLDLTITPSVPASAVAWCLVLGIGVTLLAAWIPTRRAGRAAPVAALHESAAVKEGKGRVRLGIGLVLLAVAAALFFLGMRADGGGAKVLLAGAGAGFVLIVAAVVLAPAAAVVLIRLLPPTGGAPGRLARANTVRNPRRTAATAAAITIGVALVTGVTVFASSLTASVGNAVDEGNFRGEYAISGQFQRLSPELLARIGSVPGVGGTASQDQYPVLVNGTGESLGGLGGAFADVYPLKRVAGTVDTIAPGTVMVDSDTAAQKKWTVGTKLETTFPDGTRKAFTVAGIYGKTIFVEGLQANLDEAAQAAGVKGVTTAFVTLAQGADTKAVRSGIEAVTAENPLLVVQNTDDLKDQVGGFINQLLYVVYGLLILSIVIAVLGVVNTMAMAVLERTREIGLLRAVGLTRRQSRRMIRRESMLIALLGALLGVVAGVLVGVALQQSTKESVGIDKLAVPFTSIVIFFVLAAVVGVIAALAPARRAARMDVLQAIATE
jgi:putative ABC transport system permease protein